MALPTPGPGRALPGDPLRRKGMVRARVAVERTARALIKMVFPHGQTDGPDDARVIGAILSLAGELRQRVHEALVHLAPGEYQDRSIGFVGAPVSQAVDLREARSRSARDLSVAPGAAYYLDRGLEGMEGVGELRAVEVTALPTPGLHVHGGPGVHRVARMVFDYLKAHLALLSLPAGWLDDRGLAVQVEGEVEDADSLALALLIAMTTALRKTGSDRPWVAVGSATLHGHVVPPADLAARLRAVPRHARLAVPPEAEAVGMDPDVAHVLVSNFDMLLRIV